MMKLKDVIKEFDSLDEELIIFQEDKEDFNSDVLLSYGEENDNGVKIKEGKHYFYLIEVFLAKEFVEDWLQSLTYLPDENEVAKRLFEYARNDA